MKKNKLLLKLLMTDMLEQVQIEQKIDDENEKLKELNNELDRLLSEQRANSISQD